MIGTDGSRLQTVRSDDAALRLIQPQSRDGQVAEALGDHGDGAGSRLGG